MNIKGGAKEEDHHIQEKSGGGGEINSEASSFLRDAVCWICRWLRAYNPGYPQGPGMGGPGSLDYVRVRQKCRR